MRFVLLLCTTAVRQMQFVINEYVMLCHAKQWLHDQCIMPELWTLPLESMCSEMEFTSVQFSEVFT